MKLAQFYQGEMTLLHILSREVHRDHTSERLIGQAAFELGRLIPDEEPLWTTATIMVEAGEIVEQILCVAQKLHADLIVMGLNPGIAFWPIHGDNTVYNVIAEAPCPVLTLRHSQTGKLLHRSRMGSSMGNCSPAHSTARVGSWLLECRSVVSLARHLTCTKHQTLYECF